MMLIYQCIIDKLTSFSSHLEAVNYVEPKLKSKKQIIGLLDSLGIYHSSSANIKNLLNLLVKVTTDLKIEGLVII